MIAAVALAAVLGAEAPATVEGVRASVERGVVFLLKDQNQDGSWGGPRNKTMTDSFANLETHHAWTVGTTGLVVMALEEAGKWPDSQPAVDRGLDYLVANSSLKRPAEWDIDNVWGFIYGLQALARALASPHFAESTKREAMKGAAARFIDGLGRYQSPNGGWSYYANPEAAWRPEWGTSFTTAAAVLALLDAKAAGLSVGEKVLRGGVRALKRCRLPTGAYTYSVMPVPHPGSLVFIDQVKGSLCRIQACNLALDRAGETLGPAEMRRGLDLFFKEHKFIDVALRKPIPHEAYYFNSGYFYLFGHHYAAFVIGMLSPSDRAAYWPLLQREVLKTQEPDGGFWDFYISSHTKPYGTAFAVMALTRSLSTN